MPWFGFVVGTLRGGADIALLSAKEGILATVVSRKHAWVLQRSIIHPVGYPAFGRADLSESTQEGTCPGFHSQPRKISIKLADNNGCPVSVPL